MDEQRKTLEEYIEHFTKNKKVSKDEARNHAIVKEVEKSLQEK